MSQDEDSIENTTARDDFSLSRMNSTVTMILSLETSTAAQNEMNSDSAERKSAAHRKRIAFIAAMTSSILILSFGSVLLLRISFCKRLFLTQDFKIQPAPSSRRIPTTQLANDLKLNNHE